MVTGTNTAYRCQECGALFLWTRNGGLPVIPEDQENASGHIGGKPSKPLVRLKKLLGFLTCPQCGSGKVFKDRSILT